MGTNSGGVGARGRRKGWKKHANEPANCSAGRLTLKAKKRFERYGDERKRGKS